MKMVVLTESKLTICAPCTILFVKGNAEDYEVILCCVQP